MWKFTPEKLRKLQLQKAERELLEAEYLLEHYLNSLNYPWREETDNAVAGVFDEAHDRPAMRRMQDQRVVAFGQSAGVGRGRGARFLHECMESALQPFGKDGDV